jgi:MFS transporter, OFA family, oxalate/formate antiporter
VVALTGGFLYGLGVFLAAFSANGLWWLYLSYGLIGGIGVGLCYIVPVAVLVKQFPDRRGLITGIAVGGFGAGALITAPLATYLIRNAGVLRTFTYLGIAFLVVTMATGYFMQNPPDGWKPTGWIPSATQTAQRAEMDYTLGGALRTWQWWALWTLLFLNISAGISIISQESPMFQEIAKVGAVVAAGMVGVESIVNAAGRVFWAWVSDEITRRWTFVTMFLIQVGLIWILPSISSPTILTAVSFVILMCYGGGIGTMPAFTADYFGSRNVAPIYGLMLTGWGQTHERVWTTSRRAHATKQRCIRVAINEDKSRMVDLKKGESFTFLGFQYRRILSFRQKGRPYYAPKLKKRTALYEKLREVFRQHVSWPIEVVIAKINPILRGWVNYFRIGHSRFLFFKGQAVGRNEGPETSDTCPGAQWLSLEAAG